MNKSHTCYTCAFVLHAQSQWAWGCLYAAAAKAVAYPRGFSTCGFSTCGCSVYAYLYSNASTGLQVISKFGRLVLEEATYRAGILAGATQLDAMMQEKIAQTLPGGVYAAWKQQHPADVIKLVHHNFEFKKRKFNGSSPLKVDLPVSLLRKMSS